MRFVLPLAAAAALAALGAQTPASAAPPDACDTASVVAHALPAIVNVRVVRVLRTPGAAAGAPDAEKVEVFVGSGVVIDPSGIVVTNKHVIQDAALIQVTFNDGSQVRARLIAAGGIVDLAVLKVDVSRPLPTLQFGESDHLKLGQPVIAVGNPLGIGTSVSTGVVSGLDRNLMRTPFDDFIQTDASINPGNSGGPLLDCAGKVIGIDSALFSNNKLLGSIGIGFALPSDDVRFVAANLSDPSAAPPNWIGLHLEDLTARLAAIFHRPDVRGAIVTGADPDSPAALASLQPGDIITGANGQDLPDARAVLRFVLVQPSGQPIALAVWHHAHMADVTVRGQPWPHMMALRSDVVASAASIARVGAEGVGMHLTAITDADRKRFGLADASGVLIDQVTPGSQAQADGLKPGDVIQQEDDHPPPPPEVLESQLCYGHAADTDLIGLLVRSGADTRWVSIYVGHVDLAGVLASPVRPGGTGVATALTSPATPARQGGLARDASVPAAAVRR